MGTCQDVTDLVLAESALHESERRFALFMDHLPAAGCDGMLEKPIDPRTFLADVLARLEAR